MTELIDGKYEVIEKIRDGGMGSIYKVRHVLLGEIRVLKTLRSHFQDSELARQRFFREARLATSLRHPNIATVYDFSETADHTFLMIMEYIQGQNLAELLSLGPLPVVTALEVSIQALDALGYLHRKGIVHRDISPDNLMVTRGDRGELLVKLIDLGVARGDTGTDELTATGMLVGKLSYISPELLGVLGAGERPDGRSDLYSFGCVLYRLLTGVYAVEATTDQSFIMAHVHKPPRPFEETDPSGRIPLDLRNAVNRALEKDRRNRWATAEEFRDALRPIHDRLIRDSGPAPSRDDEPGTRTEKLDRRISGPLPRVGATTPTPSGSSFRKPSVRPETRRPAPLGPVPFERGKESAGAPPPASPELVPAPTSATPVPVLKPGIPRVVWWSAVSACVALLIAAVGMFISHRKVGTPRAPGTLSVSVAPWGHVLSVKTPDGRSATSVPEVPALTPIQLSLNPGSYVVVVRGPVQGLEVELPVAATVESGTDTPLRITLPGFDVEELVRTYVH